MFENMTEKELAELFNRVARRIHHMLPTRTLFVLLAFNEPGVAQYVSNARRVDIIKALRETADRLEGREDIPR